MTNAISPAKLPQPTVRRVRTLNGTNGSLTRFSTVQNSDQEHATSEQREQGGRLLP